MVKRRWSTILSSPFTWAPLIPVAGAAAFLNVPTAVIALGLAGTGVAYYWRQRRAELDVEIAQKLVKEHNHDQNDALYKRSKRFKKLGCGHCYATMGKFVRLKKKIESHIHEHDPVTQTEQEVESLVDRLCFEVADELEDIAKLRELFRRKRLPKERYRELKGHEKELHERVAHAYDTLKDTYRDLGTILDPFKVDAPKQSALDDTIHRLKEEAAIAKRVRARVEADTLAETATLGGSSELESH